MVNFGYFLLRNADCFPDRTAVVCEDRELTYSQLNAECNRLANALKLKGLRRGDRLALLMMWASRLASEREAGAGPSRWQGVTP